MAGLFTNVIFLYLALLCVAVSFFLWIRSMERRKKELEFRRSLNKSRSL